MALDEKDRDKASARLLRQALASAGTSAGAAESRLEECPEAEILAAYSERSLDADETARYELHFSQCARCRDQLAAMARAAVPVAGVRKPRISWIWTWGWLALAPVTAVLLIAAVLIARRPAAKSAVEQPLVAMQEPNQTPMPSTPPESANAPPKLAVKPPPEPPAISDDSFAGAMQRIAPLDSADDRQAAPPKPAAPAPAEKKELSRESASALSGQPRNEIQLDKSANAPATQTPGGELQYGDSKRVRSQSQTVTVESAAAPVATTAPAPQKVTIPTTTDAVSGASVNGMTAAAKKKEEPALVAGVAKQSVGASQMVVVEAPLDRDASTLVRSPDPQTLWRVSNGRYVERSVDGGSTWRVQWTKADAHVVAGSSPAADTCWLVGRGIVLLTTDGRKWHTIEPPANTDFVAVEASSADSALITSAGGHRFQTGDGGKHWNPAP